MSVTMRAGSASPCTFSLRRGPDGKTALARRELAGRPPIEQAVRLQVYEEVELLTGEIKFAAQDHVYEEALGVASELATRLS